MPTITIIIPARTERFLNQTIQNVLDRAVTDIEIIAVLDGYGDTPYEPIIDPRVRYLSLPKPHNLERHKRQAVNAAASISYSKYICWMDAHCVVAHGFDEILIRDCQDNWVMVPRRRKVDAKMWEGKDYDDSPPIDYEYWMWRDLIDGRLKNYKWNNKSIERNDIMIDDIFCAQGSFFFMTREWFNKCGFMRVEGYTGWGQEGEEICLTTILNGGRAVVDKNTWYAHLRKGEVYGRMYKTDESKKLITYNYGYDYWVKQQREFFVKIVNKFMPIPNYPLDWEKKIYGDT